MSGTLSKYVYVRLLALALANVCVVLGGFTEESSAAAPPTPSMVNYTNYPQFLNKSGPTNILFLVDMSNASLEAAYSGSNHKYPISFKASTATSGMLAANVTIDSSAGDDLVAVDSNGVAISSATAAVSTPADTFVSTKKYFGIFDPYRCYTSSGGAFVYAYRKVDASSNPDFTRACSASNQWDGNFLNWLSMRKQEMIYQALIGGRPLPAQANADGTANTLAGAKKIGENGTNSTCSNNANSCWRYVKFVPAATLTNRVPSALSSPAVTLASGTISAGTGIFFGMGEGSGQGAIYINDDATASPFDNAPANRYSIQVQLDSEPNDFAGTGAQTNCIIGDPDYMGTRACYLRERSWGLFQRMRVDDGLRVSIMYVNGSTGQGGSLQIPFDSSLNSADYTNIRNEHTEVKAPMAEALYEALCYYRKSQGQCYDNGSGAWSTGYNNTTAAAGDPYYVSSVGAIVPCCKNFVLMISPGVGINDGDAPNTAALGNLFSGTNVGVDFTQAPESLTAAAALAAGDRLDDVAYYGHTNDVRSSIAGEQNVAFYAVNAMGGKVGAKILASAAKYGGFEDKNKDDTSVWAPTAPGTDIQVCNYLPGSNLTPATAGPYYSYKEWDADADCTPDTYFDASEGEGIEDEVLKAIAEILKRAASGTSLSVLSSSTTGDGAVYQAYFFPEEFDLISGSVNQVRWTGYIQGLWVDTFGNLREDSTQDGKMVYEQDNIIETCLDSFSQAKFIRYASTAAGTKVSGPAKTCDTDGVDLREMQGVWEGGRKLAKRDLAAKPRKLFTWVDLDNDGEVDTNEQKDFVIGGTGMTDLQWRPYLQGTATGTFTATNIVNYVQGTAVTNMRNRTKTIPGEAGTYVWRLGDIVNSTPTLVGAPQERFDVLYGDQGYRKYAQRWKNRRLTVYAGANDGILHAFNGGYSHRGDDPSTTSTIEHGYYTTGPTANDASKPELGEELWGFIPYYLLPQLRWMAQDDYTHVSFVDLKAKATDVRIFQSLTATEAGCSTVPISDTCIHPDGWGTILIVGLRFGGSCGSCTAISATNNGGPPLTYNADFNADGDVTDTDDTRTFYSGYVVLDVTDPDNPKVINAFTSASLGLTTGYPTVVRVSPSGDGKTDHSNAKFYMVVGSGPHGYDGRAGAGANLFAAELVLPGASSRVLSTLPVLDDLTGATGTSLSSFMAQPITYDRDLDFRSDAVYVGRAIAPTGSHSKWWGKFYRLMMGTCSAAPCKPDTSSGTWGVDGKVSGTRIPTEMVTLAPVASPAVDLGPVTVSPAVTLDDAGNSWIFFGTGRYFSAADKVNMDRQQLIGVKDKVVAGTCPSGGPPLPAQTLSNCLHNNLTNVTGVTVSGSTVTGASSSTFSGLLMDISATDGWIIQMEAGDSSAGLGAERVIVNTTLIGGALFAPTFVPYTDMCTASGKGYIYATYYKSGTGYPEPILTDSSGAAQRRVYVGEGVASSVSIQIGAEPTGMAGYIQSSNSLLNKLTPNAPSTVWSQYLSWNSERS